MGSFYPVLSESVCEKLWSGLALWFRTDLRIHVINTVVTHQGWLQHFPCSASERLTFLFCSKIDNEKPCSVLFWVLNWNSCFCMQFLKAAKQCCGYLITVHFFLPSFWTSTLKCTFANFHGTETMWWFEFFYITFSGTVCLILVWFKL